jgi:hypothetical protein
MLRLYMTINIMNATKITLIYSLLKVYFYIFLELNIYKNEMNNQ